MVDAEIYTAVYEVPPNGAVIIKKPSVIVLSKYLGVTDNMHAWTDDRITITINDKENNFWSAIIRLNDKEAEALVKALKKALKHRKKGRDWQLIVEIEKDGKVKTNVKKW